MQNRTMLTDLYQLTMNAAYYDNGKNGQATFDLFIRKLPKDWGFFIAAGIEDAVDYATHIKFEEADIEYLRGLGKFNEDYLTFLKNFKFTGEIHAVPEGTPIGANTPFVRVTGPRMEAQLLETMLLNTINFQTMIATKANRVVRAANGAGVMEFGLRRAQEADAGTIGARVAYEAGAIGTSNVLAGQQFGVPIFGTHAHSFVMSFETELEAFRAYAKTFPDKPTLLIDTYDTVQGARNAAIVGKELEARGKKLGAVRLDSGDLADLSKKVREVLDAQGLDYVKIVASDDLNEYKIAELVARGAKIDTYGVGTELITAKPIAAVAGVYKLVEDETGAKIKLAPGKQTYPGKKQVYRVFDDERYAYDVLALEGEFVEGVPLLERLVEGGARIAPRRTLQQIRNYCQVAVARMPQQTLQLVATPYETKTAPKLYELVQTLAQKYGGQK